MRALLACALTSVFFIIIGCNSNSIFEENKDFSEGYWVFNNPAEFEFEVKEASKSYNFLFSIRNTSKYQYQNIYLQYYLEDSTGRLLSKELKNVQLFHPKTGVPMGKGLGDLFDIERTFLENYKIENKGIYKLRIDQFMRQDSLPEILSVGLKVQYADKQ